MESALTNLLAVAADALAQGHQNPQATALLRYLGYDDVDPRITPNRIKLLQAGASFRRLFQLPMPDAPGLVFIGAEGDPASLGPHGSGLPIGGFAGSGLNVQRAFEACVGEGIEYLSQFAPPDERPITGTFTACAENLDSATQGFLQAVFSICAVSKDQPLDWIQVQRLPDQERCLYPADLCLRRRNPDFAPPLKLSTGCAAGRTQADATVRAMLELIERDALALWWRGGRSPRSMVISSETATLLTQLRQGQIDRQTHLLDITTDIGIPVIVAFSARPDGYGFAFGVASRITPADAARAAIFEMCQSELSLHVIEAKRHQSGQAALNESDLRQHVRATQIDTRRCLLLRPDEPAATVSPAVLPEMIAHRLAKRGIVAYSLDLTRPQFAVPVVRVITPGLQNEPCAIATGRLMKTIAQTGGGTHHTGDIALM